MMIWKNFVSRPAIRSSRRGLATTVVYGLSLAVRFTSAAGEEDGNNAAAELLGVPTRPYHQKACVSCLDLGEAGALFTRGWDREVEMVGDVAKKTKQEINTVWIYPPKAERAAALASADPENVTKV